MFRPIHFEIHADDVVRAQEFYSALFGWRFEYWGELYRQPYWRAITAEDEKGLGIDGGILPRRAFLPDDPHQPTVTSPVRGFPVTVDVPDIDKYIMKALRLGATLVQEKTFLDGVGWLAFMNDTEENLLGMLQINEDHPHFDGEYLA